MVVVIEKLIFIFPVVLPIQPGRGRQANSRRGRSWKAMARKTAVNIKHMFGFSMLRNKGCRTPCNVALKYLLDLLAAAARLSSHCRRRNK